MHSIWENIAGCKNIGHFEAVCKSRKAREVNEIENQDEAEEDIEMVSIDSFQFNKNCYVLTANLKTAAGHNKIVVAYKNDMGMMAILCRIMCITFNSLTKQKNSWPKLEIKE